MAINVEPIPNPTNEDLVEITSLEQILSSFNPILKQQWIQTKALKSDGSSFNIRTYSNFSSKNLEKIKSFTLREKKLGEDDSVLELTAVMLDGQFRDLGDVLIDFKILKSGRYAIRETQIQDEEGQSIHRKEIVNIETGENPLNETIFSITYPHSVEIEN